jgi:cytochrome b
MPHLTRFTATLMVAYMSMTDRLRSVAKGDRGDSPVSTAIIVAVLAAAAVLVTTAILAVTNNWLDKLRTSGGVPNP